MANKTVDVHLPKGELLDNATNPSAHPEVRELAAKSLRDGDLNPNQELTEADKRNLAKLATSDSDRSEPAWDALETISDKPQAYIKMVEDREVGGGGKTKVYIMQAGDEYYKVGKSKRPKERIEEIRTSSPMPVDLLMTRIQPEGSDIEKHLHLKYSDYNTHREWFQLPDQKLEELMEDLDMLGAIE